MEDEAFYFTYNDKIINIYFKQLINAFKQKNNKIRPCKRKTKYFAQSNMGGIEIIYVNFTGLL